MPCMLDRVNNAVLDFFPVLALGSSAEVCTFSLFFTAPHILSSCLKCDVVAEAAVAT